jgi:hypothetical protein
MVLKSAGIMKHCCIGKDIDGVQLTTFSLFGDDGVVSFTSRLLATVFKRVSLPKCQRNCQRCLGCVENFKKDCHLFFVFPPCVKIGRC